ncbi:PLD nuclease N-terminal domain-containing protein [Rhodococcus sp. AG1013]|uniref:PLD nuclease N-terminal domain-containing protein n=1 Tax=unclassified Rhodococcus (in: high G+C Gram-positive bacteria) TaxID=192944 RepID=UPI000E0A5DAC|nr:PLD nuclease N-terminal domain-containing protein [Rhodococcus sp. AG1013]RDI32392.1 phospholipase D-like protein [Rhodococcus sp. AG1013]
MDEHNPTLPVAFDITALVVALLWLVLVVATSVSVLRARHITTPAKFAWILVVLALPVLGALAWLLMGNKPGAADMRSDSPPR